jgi:hypothetical protein
MTEIIDRGQAAMVPAKTFEIVTTAQVERTYIVQADDVQQAQARLRTYLKDADMLREGVVVEKRDKQIDSTPQRIKAANETRMS